MLKNKLTEEEKNTLTMLLARQQHIYMLHHNGKENELYKSIEKKLNL